MPKGEEERRGDHQQIRIEEVSLKREETRRNRV
jgi:hypothetical protein